MTRRISKVAVEFLESYLGEYEDRKGWRNFRCPYHLGSRFNFGVNLVTGSYKCLGCASSGSLVDLIRDLKRGGSGGSGWGRGMLAQGGAPEWTGDTSPAAPRVRTPATTSIPKFVDGFQQITAVSDSISKKMAVEYLKRRRINTARWEVGLCDTLHGRVVFPFRMNSQVCYYMGRAFVPMAMKTINPDVEDGWPGKGEVLFNHDFLKEEIILCEGIFDAISAETELNISATCLLGKTISEKQKQLLKKQGVRIITVMLDADARPDAIKLSLELYKSGFVVWLVDWRVLKSDVKDPNDCSSTDLIELYQSGLSVNYLTEIQLLAE